MVAMEVLDDYSFGLSDLVALWLTVRPLAALLAVQDMGDAISKWSAVPLSLMKILWLRLGLRRFAMTRST